jgi:hypothetical protein
MYSVIIIGHSALINYKLTKKTKVPNKKLSIQLTFSCVSYLFKQIYHFNYKLSLLECALLSHKVVSLSTFNIQLSTSNIQLAAYFLDGESTKRMNCFMFICIQQSLLLKIHLHSFSATALIVQ